MTTGLIDAWGGLSDAISLAADRAGVSDDFSISVPSQAPDLFTRIFTLLSARAGPWIICKTGWANCTGSMPDYRRSFHGRECRP